MRLAEPCCSCEVEGGEGFARWQAGLGLVALDAALRPLGDLEFQQGAEQAGGGPAFAIGDRDVMLPVARDAGQAQGGEQTGQNRGVDRVGHDSTAMRPASPSKVS